MAQIARLGDRSDHGGFLLSASSVRLKANGIRVAVDQDLHFCPIPGHGITPVTATSVHSSGGRGLLRTGDHALCGAAISTGSPNVNVNR